MFYAQSTGGFYDAAVHGGNIPADAVEITRDEHAALLSAQSAGKRIEADANGYPVAVDPPPPPPPIPTRITMRQARRALYDAGLLDHVNAAVAAFPGDIGDKARIDWEYAQDIKRDDPIVQAMIPSLGLTEPQLDALFTAAAAL